MKNKDITMLILVAIVLMVAVYYYSVNNNTQTEKSNISTTTTAGILANKTTTKSTSQTYTSNYTKIGQRTLINGIYITPVKVSYDGRCPIDVKCIQAGTVDLAVIFENGTTQNTIITLNRPTTFSGKIISLTNITPNKVSTKVINDSDYRFLISVK